MSQTKTRQAGPDIGPPQEGIDNSKRSSSAFRKRLWAIGGFICFGVGCIGVVLPILPTTPFILVAAFCFARSSEHVDRWFRSTKVYHEVIEGYATKKRMTLKAKLTILIPVTLLLGVPVFFMRNVRIWAGVLIVVWLVHVVYFGFVVPTDRDAPASAGPDGEGAVE